MMKNIILNISKTQDKYSHLCKTLASDFVYKGNAIAKSRKGRRPLGARENRA